MTKEVELLRSYCKRLNIEPEIADLYCALQNYGPQTISELARHSGIERIRIYRMLDEIRGSGLIEIDTAYKRNILRAAPVSNLEILLTKREQDLRDMQRDYASLRASLETQTDRSAAASVRFYEGLDGIKQMLWNQTKGTGERLAILHDNIQHKANAAFFERWVRECNKRGLRSRGIVGDHFIHTQQRWYATHANERLTHWQARYVPENVFSIPFTVVVYDDVVIYYDWQNNDQMFGIEVRNAATAQMQRQLFELLWQKAQPVDDTKGPPQSASTTSNAS
jgi:DNA-binding MarR family transcriptional regulator